MAKWLAPGSRLYRRPQVAAVPRVHSPRPVSSMRPRPKRRPRRASEPSAFVDKFFHANAYRLLRLAHGAELFDEFCHWASPTALDGSQLRNELSMTGDCDGLAALDIIKEPRQLGLCFVDAYLSHANILVYPGQNVDHINLNPPAVGPK